MESQSNYRLILESGRATASINNQYAWLALFTGNIDDQTLAAAQQANLSTRENDASYLQTLACLDAALGRTAEARQLLLQAMIIAGLEMPDSSIWLGFGLIDEQYGLKDAARASYQRVTVEQGNNDPVGAFALARLRLSAMQTK